MKKCAFLAAYEEMIPIVQRIVQSPKYREAFKNYTIELHYFPDMYEIPVDPEWDFIITRGYSIGILKRQFSKMIFPIPMMGNDIVNAIRNCQENPENQKIGLIGDYSNLSMIKSLGSIVPMDLKIYVVEKPEDIEREVKRAIKDGCNALIGGTHATKYVKKKGLNIRAYAIRSSQESIEYAFDQAAEYIRQEEEQLRNIEVLRLMAENITDGLLYVDGDNRVQMSNSTASRMLQVDELKGMDLGKELLFLGEEIDRVRKSGKNISNEIHNYFGKNYSVDIIPLKSEGRNYTEELLIILRDINAMQKREARIRTRLSQRGLSAKYEFKDIIYECPKMRQTVDRAKKYARVDSNVLILGETGTGKELVAQSIHNESLRKEGPFVAVNCAAFPENLLESELFGYEEGAFTGAVKGGKMGLLELAHKGSIFLDEISELPLGVQGKLLRVLQEREIRRIGGKNVIKIDVRIISATNKNLEHMIADGLFREDLYYRLDVLEIMVPPLRERGKDVELLADYYLNRYAQRLGTERKIFSEEAKEYLRGFEFKGNIRQLRNLIERMSVTVDHSVISVRDLDENLDFPREFGGVKNASLDYTREEVLKLLEEYHYNKTRVAQKMNVNRTTLWRMLKKWDIQ